MCSRYALIGLACLFLALNGCMAVASPVAGVVYTDAKFGNMATSESGATKEGKACATSILALIASGDASVMAAKSAGGITEVSSVDHSAKNILGIYGEFCTIVKGK